MTIDLTCVEREGREWPGQCGWRCPNTEALPVAAPTAEAQEHKVKWLWQQHDENIALILDFFI